MPNNPALTIEQANPASILIDRGRRHAQSQGLSESGPMDEQAFLWANQLVNNSNQAAAIEIALGGLSMVFHTACTIAITGADMQATLNRQAIAPWQSYNIKTGDTLRMGFSQYGNYAYLAIHGGFAAGELFNSKSCVLREHLGGHNNGQALHKGDSLLFNPQQETPPKQFTPRRFQRDYRANVTDIRLLPCYQFEQFSAEARRQFFNQCYHATQLSDRMGYRLSGEAIELPIQAIISEGIALGSVQISNDGQPIVLMRDRQTIGGYPKIGTVISSDIETLAQLKPNSHLQFVLADVTEAYEEKRRREQFFA